MGFQYLGWVHDEFLRSAVMPGRRGVSEAFGGSVSAIDPKSGAATVLSLCSETFRKHFEDASMIIAKGQANYETLSDAGAKVFCLLQVKCPIIGLDLNVPVGSIVARQCTSSGR